MDIDNFDEDHFDDEATPKATTLFDVICQASSALSVYRSPDIDEALERIDALLIASGEGSIANDHVVRIDQQRDRFVIHTEWSARNCAQTSRYDLPYSIVKADNPLAAAVTWARTQAIAKAERRLEEAKSSMRYAQDMYDKACAMSA